MSQSSPDPAGAAVPALEFREGMARLAAAVNIVTTDGPGGRAGFTASAVCSVTDTPPTLLVCFREGSSIGAAFRRNSAICVNTLGPEHEELARRFGGRTPPEERFAMGDWLERPGHAPVLAEALASFEGEVTGMELVGSHCVAFARVTAVHLGGRGAASLYLHRRFHSLPL